MKIRQVINVVICVAAIFGLSACKSNKASLTYFSDLENNPEKVMPTGSYEIRLVPDDELKISVSALDPAASEDFNLPFQPIAADNTQLANEANKYRNYQSYVVSPDGDITFPKLGKIHVIGMTIPQLTEYLTERISAQVVDPIVTVELLNFHINVMGEVNRPGAISVRSNRYSVLDALADAGDMSPYGQRNRVLLIREEDGHRVTHRLNINESSLLESPYFYLRQNDVIYVEPNDIVKANSRISQEKQYRISLTSVIVSAASVIASLAITLFRK